MPWSRAQLQELPSIRKKQYIKSIVDSIVSKCVIRAEKGLTHYAWDMKKHPMYHANRPDVSAIALALTDELVGCDIYIENELVHIDWK